MEAQSPESHLNRQRPCLLLLSEITVLSELQSRAGRLNEEVVLDYMERYESLRELEPIPLQTNEIVHQQAFALYDRTGMPRLVVVTPDCDTYWLASGFHRYAALERLGIKTQIAVEVYKGMKTDAAYISMTSNRSHGLRRSNADKRRAVRLALEHSWTCQMSNRGIADIVGVGHHLVESVRTELINEVAGYESDTFSTANGSQLNNKKLISGGRCAQLTSQSAQVGESDTFSTANGSQLTEGSENPFSPPKRMGRDGKLRSIPSRRSGESVPDIGVESSGRVRKKTLASAPVVVNIPDNPVELAALVMDTHGGDFLIEFYKYLHEIYDGEV